MVTLIYIAMLVALFSALLKASLLEWWKGVLFGVLLALFCWLMIPMTAQSSRMVVESFLSEQKIRQYVAILATVECAIALAFAFRQWRQTDLDMPSLHLTWWQRHRRQWLEPLWAFQKHYFTLLIFPTLFFIQTQLVYAMPGRDFRLPACIVGGGMLLLIPLVGWLLREVLPSRAMREKMLLLSSVLLSLLVLISTNHDEVLTSRPQYERGAIYGQLLLTLLFFFFIMAIGFLLQRRRGEKHHSRAGKGMKVTPLDR